MAKEQKKEENLVSLLKGMEDMASQMRELIIGMPPHDLLGYIYAQYMMGTLVGRKSTEEPDSLGTEDQVNDNQFLLEYVHAVLASSAAPPVVKFKEESCAKLFKLARELREQAMVFAMATSASTKDGLFGPDTADIEFRAKTTWVLLRGSRHQVLEGEFYSYVLHPHDEILREVYGVGAVEIAEGFQAIADAVRTGPADAIEEMFRQFEAVQAFAAAQGKSLKASMDTWVKSNAESTKAAGQAIDNLFRGGIANVSRNTKLPPILLSDLAYQRGEETDFFAPGDYSGTPFRTLPARKKPLIQLGSDYYAIDPCLIRDVGYRALLHNLLQRQPSYKRTFESLQKKMSEAAFSDILNDQLRSSTVYQEVYYKDTITNKWSENDTLILIDDVLILVEAKGGAAATIASPELDFDRHARSVQDLIIKAYKQCERFFNYINSADEVPIYHMVDGKYEEVCRVRHSDYRVMVPIGLTVESFSPFSTYCKELPEVVPLLGAYAFVSLSIDELLVLRRFLPTAGALTHYLEVRQAVAKMRRAHLFDEFDHLGAYLSKNRFDEEIADQLRDGKVDMLVWDGMSKIVDSCFEGEDWESKPFPTQEFPEELLKLLAALDTTRGPGWLSADSCIRDLGDDGRRSLAKLLSDHRQTLNKNPARYFLFACSGKPLFVWLQHSGEQTNWTEVNEKASATILAVAATNGIGVVVEIDDLGTYQAAQSFMIRAPIERTDQNSHIYEDAARMAQPQRALAFDQSASGIPPVKAKKLGRNDPCPCGSGRKYKKCHGR